MPDLALRLNRDMLVMTTSFDYQLASQGFTSDSDREYVVLCEPELIDEAYKLEKVINTPCFVTPTEGMTEAQLAHGNYPAEAAADMVRSAYEAADACTPQHIIASLGPSGLPLDPSSAPSLKQSRMQYQNAARVLAEYPFDAVFLTGFSDVSDAQCALMGVRAVYDGLVMISLVPNADGSFADGRTLADAVELCDEYGADVIGIRGGFTPDVLVPLASTVVTATNKAVLVEIDVNKVDKRQFEPTDDNPYPTANEMTELAVKLYGAGVQFLRAVGAATPAYTGALLSTVSGHDVVMPCS